MSINKFSCVQNNVFFTNTINEYLLLIVNLMSKKLKIHTNIK